MSPQMVTPSPNGIQTMMDLFTLMSIGSTRSEMEQDSAKANSYMLTLIPKLFNARRYDKREPSHFPVEVLSYLLVDHIEQMNELEQTLTFHGTSILSWEDRRLAWEPSDFGNLAKLSFTDFSILRFWTPEVKIKGVTVSGADPIQYFSSRITLANNGRVVVESGVSLKASCRVDLSSYPYDNQTCFVLLYTPSYPSAKVSFSPNPAFLHRQSVFADHNMTTAVGYDRVELQANRFFMFRGLPVNDSVALGKFASLFTSSVVRYQLLLQRDAGSYLLQVAVPLYSLMAIVFIGSQLRDPSIASTWLAFSLLLQLVDLDRLLQFLPSDYDSEPFCSGFEHDCMCVMSVFYKRGEKNFEARRRLDDIESWVKYGLIVEGDVGFWFLFC